MVAIEKVLRAVSPKANPEFVKASVNAGAIMAEFGITSPAAQAQIIGQMSHESGGFRLFEEGLSYSAARLTQVWPRRFPSLAEAEPYARNPKELANKVYNGRMGNRPGTDDGWNYRGSGPLQHTGASEFARVERRTSLPVTTNPSLLRSVQNADAMWKAGCSYFVDRGALAAANAGNTAAVTLKVNGGQIGIADRKIMVERAAHALSGVPIATEMTTREQADDAKRKAQTSTVAAPVGGGGAGEGTRQADKSSAGAAAAIGVGLVVFVIIAIVAFNFWRKHFAKKVEVETAEIQSIEARISMPAAAV